MAEKTKKGGAGRRGGSAEVRMGRPPTHGESRRDVITFRATNDVREWLKQEVQEGRAYSLATAIIDAVRAHRDNETQLVSTFGGKHNLALGLLVARIACGVEHEVHQSWSADTEVFEQVQKAIQAVLGEVEPSTKRKGQADASPDAWQETAAKVVRNLRDSGQLWWPLISDQFSLPNRARMHALDAAELLRVIPIRPSPRVLPATGLVDPAAIAVYVPMKVKAIDSARAGADLEDSIAPAQSLGGDESRSGRVEKRNVQAIEEEASAPNLGLYSSPFHQYLIGKPQREIDQRLIRRVPNG